MNVDQQGHDLRGWLPITLDFQSQQPEVHWLFFGNQPILEPMFSQTVARFRARTPPAAARTTGLDGLANFPTQRLSTGFIFHVSRCGSTLLANSLRAAHGTVVISEPAVVSPLLMPLEDDMPEGWKALRNGLLMGAVNAFRQRRIGDEESLIIKFCSWQIISLMYLRLAMPQVPILIMVRDPVEIMVSCLDTAPAWMELGRNQLFAERLFGWHHEKQRSMSVESLLARALGRFFKAAEEQVGPNCRILDYCNLRPSIVPNVAKFLNCDAANIDLDVLGNCFRSYSKGPRQQAFQSDTHQKQCAATDAIRREADTWAFENYLQLKKFQDW